MLMKCPRVQLVLATVIASAGLLGCGGEKEKPAPPPPGVTIAPVIQQDVPIRQEVVGTMLGNVDADIRPKVEGFLLSRVYAEGQLVAKGQVMYQLDRRQAQAAVEQAEGNLARAQAALSQAQIDVARYTPLVAQKAVSQAELDKAHSERNAAAADGRSRPGCTCQHQAKSGLDDRDGANFGHRGSLKVPNRRLN